MRLQQINHEFFCPRQRRIRSSQKVWRFPFLFPGERIRGCEIHMLVSHIWHYNIRKVERWEKHLLITKTLRAPISYQLRTHLSSLFSVKWTIVKTSKLPRLYSLLLFSFFFLLLFLFKEVGCTINIQVKCSKKNLSFHAVRIDHIYPQMYTNHPILCG